MSKPRQPVRKPSFNNEDEEAKWWSSAEGRRFVKEQSAARAGHNRSGSPLVSRLNKASNVQIALRLPAPDIAQARQIAERKGIGYQTLLKMLVHEGLQREARRK